MITNTADRAGRLTLLLRKRLVDATPRMLALLDKNPLSATAGSFDRRYWSLKVLDFRCGMQQELARPLAWLAMADVPDNPYRGLARLQEYVGQALDFHARAIHRDGSLDDYFPFERAFGATAYALAALTETAGMVGASPAALAAMEKSGAFLASYREAGVLANHLAIAAAALTRLFILTGKTEHREAAGRLLDQLADLQHPEGWFREYEGCDLGYQTVTVEFLARAWALNPNDRVLAMLSRLVPFLEKFLHPDGSLGGEYGSRNTYNFYPGGFALLSSHMPAAARVLDGFLTGVENGAENHLDDDALFGHLLSSYVTVLETRDLTLLPPEHEPPEGFTHYPGAGFFTGRAGRVSVYGAVNKGGVFKVFENNRLAWSDTGLAGRLADGRTFCQSKIRPLKTRTEPDLITISGRMIKFGSPRLSPLQTAGLRLLALAFGRWSWYSHAVRRLMQAVLIYKKDRRPVGFARTIRLDKDGITVEDRIAAKGRARITAVYRTPDLVTGHVVTSDAFQSANLLPWDPLPMPADGRAGAWVRHHPPEIAPQEDS